MSKLGPQLIASLMATADAFLRESHRLFRPFGLTGAQYNVLNVLAARYEGLSQRELSEILVVDRSNVTGLLDRMGAAGWVKREDDPADRRVYRVSLTPAGRKLWSKVTPRYEEGVSAVTRALSPAEMKATIDTLTRLERAAVNWRKSSGGKLT